MMRIETGRQLGHYQIIARLGAGGMGEIYRARDTRLDREVALKLLPAEFTQDADRVRRFIQEAKAASALNHPNIITIYEIGEVDGTHFIATEFVEGQTLRQWIAGEKMRLPEVLGIATQVTGALAEAHSAGIVHRDIKPENVMVRPDGLVKILDFGLAKLTEVSPSPVDTEAPTAVNVSTETGAVMGTPRYMSPEQARGQKADARTDLFSLGVMLYELLSGRAPFTGETVSHIIVAILEKEPVPLARAATGVPAELERIVSKALRKDREERYQTAKDLVVDLKSLKQELEIEAKLKENADFGMRHAESVSQHPQSAIEPHTTSSVEFITGEIRKHKLGVAVSSLLGLALIGIGIWLFFLRAANDQAPIDSLAVLPFQYRSGNADSEFLSDGLAESLIYRLSQLPNLKVSPTSTVFRYKGQDADPRTIGSELGVQAVMSGRMAQRGENLTISVELVDVRSNKTLWGERYERKLSDLLSTQREIATEITARLQLKLTGEGEQKLAKRYTSSNDAYQLYLKGRFHWAKRTKSDMLKSIEHYQQALELDPNFALAYVGMAESYNSMGKNPDISPKEAIPQAKAAARRALEIDPSLAEAHSALADSLAIYDWNWAESEREFKRAIELDPNVSYIHVAYALGYLTAAGRAREVVAELERALELEPLSLINNAVLVSGYLYARQNDKALQQARKAYDLDPNFPLALHWLGQAYIDNGLYDEAITLGENGLKKGPSNPTFIAFLGQAYAKSGRQLEAQQFIERLREAAKTQYVRTYYLACIYVALGDKDKAFAELEKSLADKDCYLPRAKIDPLMDALRDDPRFNALLKRMHLPG
jgi:serine/threonine protein kinase/Tfp pilus assembly protein PilF